MSRLVAYQFMVFLLTVDNSIVCQSAVTFRMGTCQTHCFRLKCLSSVGLCDQRSNNVMLRHVRLILAHGLYCVIA
jgi:hypothetical protein